MLGYVRGPLAALRSNQLLMDTIAHNMSNLNTNGFRRVQAEFADVVYRDVQAVMGQPQTARSLSGGVVTQEISRSFELGQFQQTGNPLDLALNGEGFFQVQLPDGRVGYTRDGSFGINSIGRLATGAGQAVVPEIVVPADATRIYVYPNGAVFTQRGAADRPEAWQQIGQIQVATFPNLQGLVAAGANTFVASPAAGLPLTGNPGDVLPGEPNARFGELLFATIESSNVNPMLETTTLMMALRAYSANVRSLQTIDQMIESAVSVQRG